LLLLSKKKLWNSKNQLARASGKWPRKKAGDLRWSGETESRSSLLLKLRLRLCGKTKELLSKIQAMPSAAEQPATVENQVCSRYESRKSTLRAEYQAR
jgi:hypothetical protein